MSVDLHKQIAEDVRSKADRDAALQFLRAGYSAAVRGTAWEQLHADLTESRPEFRSDDPIEFYEVEDRPVAVVWPDEGMGTAWVWNSDRWGVAPGLVNKSWLEGQRLSRGAFREEFPEADITKLEQLANDALGAARPIDFECRGSAASRELEEDPFYRFERELIKAVGAWAEKRSLDIADRVRDELRQIRACGIFDDDELESLWDEYSLQTQSGPDALEPSWNATIDPIIDWFAEQLPATDAALMTLWKRWSDDDLADLLAHDTIDADALRRLARRALNRLADEEPKNWITG